MKLHTNYYGKPRTAAQCWCQEYSRNIYAHLCTCACLSDIFKIYLVHCHMYVILYTWQCKDHIHVLHSWTLAVSVHQNKVMQATIFFTTLWLNSAFVLSCRCSLAMPELPKLCKISSSQAISLQYLIVFTSNWVQRSLRGLGMFAYTALLKCLPQSKLHTIFHHIFLFCKLLKHWHFVILLTVNSTFKYNQFWSVQIFDQNLVPTPPEMILYLLTRLMHSVAT